MTAIWRAAPLAAFACLCEKCEDTCCKGWSMQVDDATLTKYKTTAPDLLAFVEPGSGTPGDADWIMRKDASGQCMKLEDGRCGIHAARGANMLGDACYFYPRVTRKLGSEVVMTASLSCPEIARLTFADDSADFLDSADAERLPTTMKDYLPEGLSAEDALAIHRAFLAMADDPSAGPEKIFARINSVSRSLSMLPKKDWAGAVPVFIQLADGRVPAAEPNINDPFNLLHALAGLIAATKKPMPERLRQTLDDMQQALGASLDWENVLIHTNEHSLANYHRISALWKSEMAEKYNAILKRTLKMQLSLAMFPFAGLGESLSDRVTVIGVRLATMKLALMCGCGMAGGSVPPEVVVRVIQSISRFLDHLGDPVFSLSIYSETGWTKEPRMRGLLEM